MKNYLSIKNLSYSYPDGHLALKKISFNFTLPNKKTINLIGDNTLARKVLKWKPKLNHLLAFKEILEK